MPYVFTFRKTTEPDFLVSSKKTLHLPLVFFSVCYLRQTRCLYVTVVEEARFWSVIAMANCNVQYHNICGISFDKTLRRSMLSWNGSSTIIFATRCWRIVCFIVFVGYMLNAQSLFQRFCLNVIMLLLVNPIVYKTFREPGFSQFIFVIDLVRITINFCDRNSFGYILHEFAAKDKKIYWKLNRLPTHFHFFVRFVIHLNNRNSNLDN